MRRVLPVVRVQPPRPSYGELYGLHKGGDALELKSSVALVMDADTDEVLFSKYDEPVDIKAPPDAIDLSELSDGTQS